MMQQYVPFELRFAGEAPAGDRAAVDLRAVFTGGGRTVTVPGFYDGDGQYAVRFLPEETGVWRWEVSGLFSETGAAECLPAEGCHGPVRAVGTHFEHADGTLFLPFGTTVYALASQDDALVEETLDTLSGAPFNKVRMCVFPKHYDYNHNEPPCFPFARREDGTWDVRRPDPAFWRRFERILDRIGAMGIQVDLILFHPYDRWGFASLPQEDNLVYLDYLLRRLAARPYLWWSLANEYDLCPAKSLADWEEIEGFVASHDPFAHLLSCHNCFRFWDASRPHVTHASLQTKALAEIPRWIRETGKPVVIDECCYEGNLEHFWGSISGPEMTRRFWRCCASGAFCTHGETFRDPEDVLWWAKGGVLKGQSPARIAFLREILESLPGPLEPWVSGWSELGLSSGEELRAAAEKADAPFRPFLRSLAEMDDRNRWAHMAAEHTWQARCGDEALLWFHDLQCYGKQVLTLPAGKHYRVEVIDTWNMTRSTYVERAGGRVVLQLPGQENLAVLAVRTD